MAYAMYHSRLEISFLMNEWVLPPSLPSIEIFDGIADSNAAKAESEMSGESQRNAASVVVPAVGNNESLDVFTDERTDKPSNAVNDCSLNCGGITKESTPLSPSTIHRIASLDSQSNLNVSDAGGDKKRDSVTSEHVTDMSDPLHSYLESRDETIFHSDAAVALTEEKKHRSRLFRKALDEVILSISPCLRSRVPYLETEAGSSCRLRAFFPPEIYWSEHFEPELSERRSAMRRVAADAAADVTSGMKKQSCVTMLPPHPFIVEKICAPISDHGVQVRIKVKFIKI